MRRFKQCESEPAFTFDSYVTGCEVCDAARRSRGGTERERERGGSDGEGESAGDESTAGNQDGVRGLREMRGGDGWI